MQKNPDRQAEDILEIPRKKKARRNRRETECHDKLRSFDRCGICGSSDLIYEVLIFCPLCGVEQVEVRAENHWFWSTRKDMPNLCQCDRGRLWPKYPEHVIAHCNACHAHKGPLCRNCGRSSWYRFDPLRPTFHCLGCGFATL